MRTGLTGAVSPPASYSVFLLGSARTGVAMAATPNFALAGSAIASAHNELLKIARNRVEYGYKRQTGRALYGCSGKGANP